MIIDSTIKEKDPYRGTSTNQTPYVIEITAAGNRGECERLQQIVFDAIKGNK